MPSALNGPNVLPAVFESFKGHEAQAHYLKDLKTLEESGFGPIDKAELKAAGEALIQSGITKGPKADQPTAPTNHRSENPTISKDNQIG